MQLRQSRIVALKGTAHISQRRGFRVCGGSHLASVRMFTAATFHRGNDVTARRVQLGSYGVATLAVAIATMLRLPLRPLLGDAMPFFLFTPAVLIAAFNGGIKPGLFAVALSALAGDFFFQAPIYSLTPQNSKALLTTFLFVLNSAMIAALGAGLHRAWRQAELHASETMSHLDRVWQSEQRSRRLIETAFEGIWSLDVFGTATFVNARIAEMLGYPLSRVTSRPVLDFVFDEDREAMQSRLDALHGGGVDVFEFRFRKRDGSPLWCMVSVRSILDRDDVYLGCLLMVTDISERILEKAAAQNERRRVRHRIGQLSTSLQEILIDLRHAESTSSTTSDDLRSSIEQLSHLADLSTRTAEQLACDPARISTSRYASSPATSVAGHALSNRASNEVATALVSSPS